MIITCPQCETRYSADDASFPASGRKVRCSKCTQVWHQSAPEPERVLAADAASATDGSAVAETVPRIFGKPGTVARPQSEVPRRSWAERLGLIAGWTGLALMLVLIGWTGLRFRQEIASLWPQSSALYATFGVKVNSGGIEINDVTYHHDTENGHPVLEVTGKLVNVSSREVAVPRVRVTLTDNDQHELYHWIFNPPQRTLGVGRSLGFSTRLASPPPAAEHFQLHFASQD